VVVAVMGALTIYWNGSSLQDPFGERPWLTFLGLATFCGNWVLFSVNQGLGWFGPAWTLGIEEQFYLTWPILLVAALKRRVRRGMLYVGFAVVLLGALLAAAVIESHVGKWRAFYATPTQLPSILFGCLLGYELTANPTGRLARLVRSRLVALVGLAGMVATSIYLVDNPGPLYKGGYAVYATFACLLIGHCFVRAAEPTAVTRFFGWKPFVVIGQISYEAYLIHTIVIIWMLQAFPTVHVYPMMILDAIIVAVVSAVLYYTIEQPIRRRGWKAAFRRRAARRPRRALAVAPIRRVAVAGGLAGVLAVAGVGVVAARTASPGQLPAAPIAFDEAGISIKGGPNHVDRPAAGKDRQPDAGAPAQQAGTSVPSGSGAGSTASNNGCGRQDTCSPPSGREPRVLAAPTIIQILPPTGAIAGGTTMTIRGAHFIKGVKVFFNNLRLDQVTRVSNRELRIVTPAAQLVLAKAALTQLHGLQVAVQVVTAGGRSAVGLTSHFTYL
jgi:peptidoglycan/LPS O-acetylase OafA/YrhL